MSRKSKKLQQKAKIELRVLNENGFSTGNLGRAMEEYAQSQLQELQKRIDNGIGSWDSDDRFNECKKQVLNLIDQLQED